MRARLAVMWARNADVLLLDEPTNHLGIPAREAIEAAIAAFPGVGFRRKGAAESRLVVWNLQAAYPGLTKKARDLYR